MNFDELLDFLFHKWIGICISIGCVVLLTLGLTSCIPLDFCACWCGTIGCEDAAESCEECSVDFDDECFSCFGGRYEYVDEKHQYVEGSSCALNECLFGKYGCESECGSCYTVCGGVNLSCMEALCNGDGCRTCYSTSYGTKRSSCLNCVTYCDGEDDPDSPNYSPDYLYSVKVVDYYGNETTVGIYSNTTSLPYESIKGMTFRGYYSRPNGEGTRLADGVLPASGAKVYAYYTDAFEGQEFTFEVYVRYQEALNTTVYTTPTSLSTFAVYSGELISTHLPMLPEAEGYYFDAWRYESYDSYYGRTVYTEVGDETGLFTTHDPLKPAEFGIDEYSTVRTIKLYADFKLISYNATIVFPSFMGINSYSKNVIENTPVSELEELISSPYNGYIFAGFSLREDTSSLLDDGYLISSNVTLYAVYKEPVNITFKEDEESDDTYTESYYEGQSVVLPVPEGAPVGMEFDHWTYSNDYSKKLTEITVSESHDGITLIAVYKPKAYTVSFYDGESLLSSLSYYMGDTTVFSSLTKDYYVFDGWYKNPDFSGNRCESVSAADHEDYSLYAKFTPKKYTIELDDRGGVISDYDIEVSYGELFTLPIPVRTGYTFKGWYYNAGLTNKQLTDAQGNSLDVFGKYSGYEYLDQTNIGIMAFAYWQANTYTVTFEGDGVSTVTASCSHGSAVSAPTDPTKAGYVFLGWYNGSEPYDFSSKVTSDLTLTARFSPIEYTIKLVITNGAFETDGSSEMTVTYVYGSGSVTINDNPVRDGYAFSGWYATQNGSGNLYIRKNGTVTSYLDAYVITPGVLEYVLYAGWVTDNN